MGSTIIVVVIVVGLIAILILGSFRPARVTSRREVLGRPRRRLGAILAVAGVLGLVGGQWYALAGAPGRLVAGVDEEILVLHPKPGTGDADRYLVRFLPLSDLAPDRPRVLSHVSAVVSAGERVELPARGTGSITPAEFDVLVTPSQGGRRTCHITAEVTHGGGMTSVSTSHPLGADGTLTHTLDLGARDVAASFTAVFPRTVFPGSILPRTVVLVDPAPAGVEDFPIADLMATPTGDRIRSASVDPASPSIRAGIDRSRGIVAIFGSLGVFAWIMLALAGTGSAFLTARPGLGLGLFLLLAPVLIAGMDALALVHQEAALSHEDARVRASAMAGLQGSMLFGVSGPEAVAEAGRRRGGVDQEMAERVRRLFVPIRRRTLERKRIGSTGWIAPDRSSGE